MTMDKEAAAFLPPAFARDWVHERYRRGDLEFASVPESHWRLAALFCDVLSKAVGSRSDIFIVPANHIATEYTGRGRIGVCYEGNTHIAEEIQLGHKHVEGCYYSLMFHDGDCYLQCHNHWSTIITENTREADHGQKN